MLNTRLRRGGVWLAVLLALAVGSILAAGLMVEARTRLTAMRYELGELRERERELRQDVERLQIEAAALRAPEHLRPRAGALGLVPPRPGQVIWLSQPDVAGQGR